MAKRHCEEYARMLDLQYLKEVLGVDYISEDGMHIGVRGKQKKVFLNDGYYKVTLYDKYYRQTIPKDIRKSNDGNLTFSVHRLVYVWYHPSHFIPAGYVVDHINDNKLCNEIWNLQLLTPWENVMKKTGFRYSDRELKCDLNKPREYYEKKLDDLIAEYDLSKKEHDAHKTHKIRSQMSAYRARLRYYDNNKNKEE